MIISNFLYAEFGKTIIEKNLYDKMDIILCRTYKDENKMNKLFFIHKKGEIDVG